MSYGAAALGQGEGSPVWIPFDYPFCPYTFQLANYFIRGSEYAPHIGGTDYALETNGIEGI